MRGEKTLVTAIILAGGSGNRMGEKVTKQRLHLCGESLLYRSVKTFSDCDKIDSIVVVSRDDEVDWAREELASFNKIYAIVTGGKTRAESAKRGFESIHSDTDFIAIHDAARCLVTVENIGAVVEAAMIHGAATASSPVTDTLKLIGDNGMICDTVDREKLLCAQTPQAFKVPLYAEALSKTDLTESVTDDNIIIEKIGGKIYPVITGKENIKITAPEDMAYAEYILERRRGMNEIRIGHGYDVHRLVEGRKLVLGGVHIPFERGLLGHSDADVLTHAIMDALLGACALGDIGRHFPDNDVTYKDISSLELLKKVGALIKKAGFRVVNIDATLVIQRPKVAPFVETMVNNIANILDIESGRINIKATTEEHLGFTGREEGVCAHAVVSVQK